MCHPEAGCCSASLLTCGGRLRVGGSVLTGRTSQALKWPIRSTRQTTAVGWPWAGGGGRNGPLHLPLSQAPGGGQAGIPAPRSPRRMALSPWLSWGPRGGRQRLGGVKLDLEGRKVPKLRPSRGGYRHLGWNAPRACMSVLHSNALRKMALWVWGPAPPGVPPADP